MSKNISNPFSVTKAIEFSYDEIYEYWVDYDSKNSVEHFLNTSEILPKYVLGSRGCGKTHLLRYFSLKTRLKKYDNNSEELVSNDNFIGFYNTFGVLNSGNFNGKFLDEEQWLQIFKIYFEYYLCEIFIYDLIELLKNLNNAEATYWEKDVTKIIDATINFNKSSNEKISFHTLSDLLNYFQSQKSKIDKEIILAAFTREFNYSNIEIPFTPGEFIKNIIYEISTKINFFSNIKFIFILDEYDKLLEWQKIYINTLVWDKKPPMTFWIGARTYGYKTRETLTKGTTLASGSDMQEIHLDEYYRKDEKTYKIFSKKLIEKRLRKYYHNEIDDVEKNFERKFEKYTEDSLIFKLREKEKEYSHIQNLREVLKQNISNHELIIQNLLYQTNDNPLFQKYNILLFYKKWYKSKKNIDFVDISEKVKSSFIKYLEGTKSDHTNLVNKSKKDLISQLATENGLKNYEYVGLDNFIELSYGNTRSLILLLKNTIENSNIRGEKPLSENGRISLDAQYMAVYKVAEWYYNDAEIFGDNLKVFYKNIRRLSDYLKLYRITDNLTETSVLGFSYNKKEVSAEINDNIEVLRDYSILIESDNKRKGKNGLGIGEPQYHLNPIMSPLWNLPTSVRGTPTFSNETMKYIFDEKIKEEEYLKFYKARKTKLTAPFLEKEVEIKIKPNLFNLDD
ncbi:ORC-CDC6 family AAA ATPase [Epilithonimonas lactis]|uniref:Uncharacterized protein n=1 Tax=Epilithonimonas lactis TaxID=421072 RepID=A0A085BMG0_9FLAO|nr:hypothetical protein [Epilithonimonas lactis]KFC23655.1 hypothetical protein IO89_03505 [Epilithonimonas lactis]SEQ20788.1 hypothetical protein SAMN04488097_1669 [Epilithonimonas lactis]